MRSLIKILGFISFLVFTTINAQEKIMPIGQSGLQFTARIGYDFPNFKNNTPFIDYNSGMEFGVSADYYWSWYGIGIDFDYLNNKPQSIYTTQNLYLGSTKLNSFDLNEQNITRLFYGLGPDFKYNKNKFMIELNTRAGGGSIDGGKVLLQEISTSPEMLLNYHVGYKTLVFSTKAQLRFTYFFTESLGVHLGTYFINHFNAKELSESGLSAYYRSVYEDIETENLYLDTENLRENPCDCNISSIGVFAGITFHLNSKHKSKKKKEKYSLTITARDENTGILLPETDIVVKNIKGEIVKTGLTNNFGIVIFDDIQPDTYFIEGMLYDISLNSSGTTASEFKSNETLQKEILYVDSDFILKGKAVVCNTDTPLKNVSVVIKNTELAEQKSTLTDENGEYIFHVNQEAIYKIYGRKSNYFSQTETISSGDFDRNTTLFVKLEICMEEADCNKAITLKNIHYDLNMFFIREDAKPELNKLVQFMKDNPNITIEVSSHTDSRGSREYNEILSTNRANAAVVYIVSQGIDQTKIKGAGYGETRLLNECADHVKCTKQQHQINRRTEMKVVCPE